MRKRYITILAALMLLPLMAGAQALKGSYFLDGSLQRNRLNPAFAPRANYFGLPVISNVGLGVYGNVGPADFLYPKNGELYTFLNQNVTMAEFTKNLPNRPLVDIEYDTDLLNFGFFTKGGGFWNFDMGVRLDGQIGLPRDLLIFMKQGMAADEQVYSLKGFDMYQTSSVYASIGHSRDLSDLVEGLRVGGKFRAFIPLEHIGLTMGDSYITMSQDKWMVNSAATGVVASSFFSVNPESVGGDSESEFIEADMENIGPAGFGFSFDLGAEYKLNIGSVVDGMTFSLSVLDLGGYFFSNKNVMGLESGGTAVYEGIKDIGFSEDMDLGESTEAIQDEFLSLANLKEAKNPMYTSTGTRTRIYAGVEYPFLSDKMSVGLLYSGKFGYSKMMNDLTLSYNLNPCKWFNLGLNWSFLNAYKTMGWIMEFSPKAGVDFFIGSDYTFFEVMPDVFLPVDKMWMNVRFGLSFMIGGKKN